MWFFFLAMAVILVGFAAVTGIKPDGTRKVADTRLMTIGKVILLVTGLALVAAALRDGGLL